MSYSKIAATLFAALALVPFVFANESDELREKANMMQREAAELAERGRGEEAEHLERKALAMLKEAEHLEHHHPDRRKAGMRQMQERLEILRIEERELKGLGREGERLNEVRREAERIERELHEMSHDGHHQDDDSPEGITRRLEHMRVATEHLHHAGLHEIAEHVAERAEATERELHEHHHRDPVHALMKQLDEMRHEIGRLRDEVNELKQRR